MSNPKRYSFYAVIMHHIDGPDTAEIRFSRENDGMFVQWEDYARLKAEVERLRKAGDAMAELLFIEPGYIGSNKQEAVINWCKLTEGKPSV